MAELWRHCNLPSCLVVFSAFLLPTASAVPGTNFPGGCPHKIVPIKSWVPRTVEQESVDIICRAVSNRPMNPLLEPSYWAVAAGVLMLAELIVPGGIVFFLGASCLLVAGAIWTGLISTWVGALTLFFISSLLLILCLRAFFSRFVEGDFSVANTDEILDEVDQIVDVVEPIGPAQAAGVVSFRGTRWRALGDGAALPVGSRVKIVARENTTMIVAPLTMADEQPLES